MAETTKRFTSIDEYIAEFPKPVQEILEKIRSIIHQAAPDAKETISYGMPAFKLKKILVYFAAFKKHIGFYPTASGIEAFKTEVSSYISGKGSVQFPLDAPIPYDLIEKIVKYRAQCLLGG